MNHIVQQKSSRLFFILGGFFIANVLIAEFIGVKIFSLEDSLGWAPFNWNIFGQNGSLNFTAGVILWPIVFIMTDIINEYYGKKGVRFLSFLAVGLITYAFFMIFLAIGLAPADWWIGINASNGVPDMQLAFEKIFGQGLFIIIGSIVAFLVGQILDVLIFQKIKAWTGEKWLWLRATGSTLISQFVDSFIVLYIAFVLGPSLTSGIEPWSMNLFLAVGTVNYIYKFVVAVLLTPFLYLVHAIIDAYLGKPLAEKLKKAAAH